jgi:hypothetical protein
MDEFMYSCTTIVILDDCLFICAIGEMDHGIQGIMILMDIDDNGQPDSNDDNVLSGPMIMMAICIIRYLYTCFIPKV